MAEEPQDKLYATTMRTIGAVAKLPVVHVDRETFLRAQFKGSPHLDIILGEGPQAVFTVESLRKKCDALITNSATKTSAVSFAGEPPVTL